MNFKQKQGQLVSRMDVAIMTIFYPINAFIIQFCSLIRQFFNQNLLHFPFTTFFLFGYLLLLVFLLVPKF